MEQKSIGVVLTQRSLFMLYVHFNFAIIAAFILFIIAFILFDQAKYYSFV